MSKHLFSVKVRVSLGLLCLSVVCGAPLHAQSLEDTVAMALDTHPDIRQSFARFKSKEEEVNQAKAGYLPTVDLTAGYGYEYTDSPGNRRTALGFNDGDTELGRGEFGVSLRQMIFDGMFTRNEVLRTKFEASAEQWSLISTAEDLALSVSQTYLNYLKTEQVVALAEKNVSSHEIIYSQIKERTDSGLGSIADFSQISGRLARAPSNIIAARNNYQDARVELISLTNITPEELVMPVPDADMLPEDKTSGLILAIERHSIIKSAQQDIHAARAFSGSVKANYYPTLSLEIAANVDNDITGEDGLNRFGANVGGHRNDFSMMLRMRYNLYSGGKDIALERSAAYQTIEAQEVNYRAHRQVTESFGFAWNAYSMLGLRKQYIQQHVVTSKDTQEAYQQQFSLGLRNLLDLLDTENELFQARKDYLDANFDELSARYRLLNVTGQLLDSLRVTRSVEWQGEHEYSQGVNRE
jgi:adhesin transport system outer membrane protein